METDNSKEAVNREITELRCSSFHGPISNVKSYGTEAFYELYERTKSNKYKEQIEAMRAEPDPKKQSAMKSKLDYFTPSVICTERKSSCITNFSGVICADLDGKDNPGKTPQQMRVTVLNDPLLHSFMAIVSSLGKGLKVMFRYDPKTATVEDYSHAIMQYLADVCHLKADKACCDPTRACFVSYDPQAYYSTAGLMCGVDVNVWLARYKQFQGVPEKIPANNSFKYSPSASLSENSRIIDSVLHNTDEADSNDIVDSKLIAHVQMVSERIDRDIAPNYEDFLHLGLSLATLGETGRPIFKHCCSFYLGEQTRDLDKYFSNCLLQKQGRVKIGTFFNLCHAANIDISVPKSTQMDEMEVINEMENLPMFPEWIFDELPLLLQKIVSHAHTPSEKSMLLMTSLTTISSLLPNLYMVYGGDRMEANLFFFGLAKAGSGKGKMKHCSRLVKPVHDLMLSQSIKEQREYLIKKEQQKMERGKSKGRQESEMMVDPMPPLKIFDIPANSSAAAFLDILYNNGGRGIIFETEGDSLANIFKKEYGEYSEMLRSIAHNEPIKCARKGNTEKAERSYTLVEYPCLSVMLTGTPKQLKNLMETSENGLFSRFNFLYMTGELRWVNQYAVNNGKSYQTLFDDYAEDLYVIYSKLQCMDKDNVYFNLTKEQQDKVETFFYNLLVQYHTLYDGDYDGTMRRLGITHGRVCMILSALRGENVDYFDKPILCSDKDLKIALEMITVLNQHASFAYRCLSDERSMPVQMKNMTPQYRLYYSLPDEFITNDAVEIGIKLKLSASSVKRYINQFAEGNDGTGRLIEKIRYGMYRKIATDKL